MNESLKQVVDRRLDALQFDGLENKVMKKIAQERSGKHERAKWRPRRVAVLALGLVLLLAATAFAVVELTRSREYDAKLVARQAMMDTYGLTDETLGLFTPYVKPLDDGYQVTYAWWSESMKPGVYTVTIDKNGQAKATWSNDDVDAEAWQSGELSASVWGQPQLAAYVNARSQSADAANTLYRAELEDGSTWQQRAERDAYIQSAMPDGQVLYNRNVLPGEGDLTTDEAAALASQTLKDRLDVTPDELVAMGYLQTEYLQLRPDDTQATYTFLWRNDELSSIQVSFGATGDDVQLYASTFPTGKLPSGSLAGMYRAIEAYIQSGGLETLDDAERADAQSRIREAGYGTLLGDEPTGVDVSNDVLATASAALKDAYGMPDEALKKLFGSRTTEATLDGREVWQVAYSWEWVSDDNLYYTGVNIATNAWDKLGVYTVTLDKQTNEVVATAWSLDGVDDGAYTKGTWGQAKAIRADMLPWVVELLTARAEIAAKYATMQGNWYISVEDNAAADGLFREAGFDAAQYNHYLPEAGDITKEQAWELFANVLKEDYGVSRDVMEASVIAYADFTIEDGVHRWYFWIQNNEQQMSWSIVLNATTSEVISVFVDNMAAGNG